MVVAVEGGEVEGWCAVVCSVVEGRRTFAVAVAVVGCPCWRSSLLSRPGTLPVTQPSRPRPNQPCRPLWPSVCSTRCRTDPVCIQTGVPPARYRSWPSTGHHISSPNLPAAEIRRFEANLYAIASPLDFYPSLLDSVFPRASPVPPADSYCPHHA